ncbi:MAG: D-alanine--D-alanine ligase [Methylococcaceae bacterium]|nr:MAG: D-alanine--D-alanine ligase [Methylococcaceae bacterium]
MMKISLGVLFGGRSVEHEISILSALQVINAVDSTFFRVVPVYISKEGHWFSGADLLEIDNYRNLDSVMRHCTRVVPIGHNEQLLLQRYPASPFRRNLIDSIDVAFPVTHGTFGEDGCLQGMLEMYGIPYVGCDVTASALGMDKIRFKEICRQYGLPMVDYLWMSNKAWFSQSDAFKDDVQLRIGFPAIVKPANLGSSIGVTVVQSENDIDDAIDLAASFADRIIVEKLVPNLLEINCAVMGDGDETSASVCEEPLRSADFLSFADKYQSKSSGAKGMQSALRKIPAEIDEDLSRTIQNLARQTFLAVGACGVARIDFLVDRTARQVYVNEINAIPGSMSFYLWQPSGITFAALIKKLVELALKRQREKSRLMRSNPTNILALTSKSGGSKQ